ncbi:hypothetical protein OIDMADRAFT_103573 [Oidiodendron maius Zn]|uniref:THUMP domain-containing protein n=1 Tax=Oidiodendron maius (strain Zn) TaxID=913774 RepID=A0A0C3HEU0_OIDMZ|nr:hypothetical protein OIDMADRAFT_103573 [Oidiodendron maius Zn]
MAESNKRKETSGDDRDRSAPKRSKGGSHGKWQTPHQKAKRAYSHGNGKIEPGDVGIWATCAKGQERRARGELQSMFEECAERFYGIKAAPGVDENEDSDDDIETSIKKELETLGNKEGKLHIFRAVRLDMPCLLFFKTELPVDPADFVHRICEEIITKPNIRRMRYINRLTPMSCIGKATERGLEEVGRAVLAKHFQLSGEETRGDDTQSSSSYAIRPSIRNHNTLRRDAVIKQTAMLVADSHKVDLTNPDKVIIVELFQSVCGMSVVGSDWEKLKRFNLAELYPSASRTQQGAGFKAEAEAVPAMPESVTTDETSHPPATAAERAFPESE